MTKYHLQLQIKRFDSSLKLEPGQLFLNWSNPLVQYDMIKCFQFWLDLGIDGLVLQNLEHLYFDKENYLEIFPILDKLRLHLNHGLNKQILIASYQSLKAISLKIQNTLTFSYSKNVQTGHHYNSLNSTPDLLSYFDCVGVYLNIDRNQTESIRDQVNDVFLAAPKDKRPYVLWSISDFTKSRLADRIEKEFINAAMFLLAMLPGSINIFYGDEIGLHNSVDLKKVSVILHFDNSSKCHKN